MRFAQLTRRLRRHLRIPSLPESITRYSQALFRRLWALPQTRHRHYHVQPQFDRFPFTPPSFPFGSSSVVSLRIGSPDSTLHPRYGTDEVYPRLYVTNPDEPVFKPESEVSPQSQTQRQFELDYPKNSTMSHRQGNVRRHPYLGCSTVRVHPSIEECDNDDDDDDDDNASIFSHVLTTGVISQNYRSCKRNVAHGRTELTRKSVGSGNGHSNSDLPAGRSRVETVADTATSVSRNIRCQCRCLCPNPCLCPCLQSSTRHRLIKFDNCLGLGMNIELDRDSLWRRAETCLLFISGLWVKFAERRLVLKDRFIYLWMVSIVLVGVWFMLPYSI